MIERVVRQRAEAVEVTLRRRRSGALLLNGPGPFPRRHCVEQVTGGTRASPLRHTRMIRLQIETAQRKGLETKHNIVQMKEEGFGGDRLTSCRPVVAAGAFDGSPGKDVDGTRIEIPTSEKVSPG